MFTYLRVEVVTQSDTEMTQRDTELVFTKYRARLSVWVEFNPSDTRSLMVTQSGTEMTRRDTELVIATYRSGCLEMSKKPRSRNLEYRDELRS